MINDWNYIISKILRKIGKEKRIASWKEKLVEKEGKITICVALITAVKCGIEIIFQKLYKYQYNNI